METEELPDLCQDIFWIFTDMDFRGLVLWKSILHMIRMNITLRFRWDYQRYIILEEKIRRIRKSGLIIFLG